MGSEENMDRLLLQERSGGNSNVMNCSSSVCSDSMFKSTNNALDPYYSSTWDPNPIASLNHSGNFSQGHFAEPHMIGGDSSHLNYSEMARYNSGFAQKAVVGSHEKCRNSDNGGLGSSSHYGKRRRKTSPENGEREQQGDLYTEAVSKEDDEFKRSIDSDGKNVKDSNSNGEEPSKANYIHVRAKRGQATNSHSLAERVRRERISERMRLLQELVPGCNKITGKAVMLDEIINYVQSLQQQVEFLSMKLATVNPELNINIDRLLTKDIFHLQGNNTNEFGLNPGSSSHPFLGYSQGMFNGATQPFAHLPQHIWSNELQGILQMGFDPQPSSSSFGPSGIPKMNS